MTELIESAPLHATDWNVPADGSCRTEDTQLFLGHPGEPAVLRLDREEKAKKVCSGCAVLLECRAAALKAPGTAGVRGGLSPQDRAAAGRRRAWRAR